MANIRVKDLPNTDTLVDGDELIVDSSSAGTRRVSYGEVKTEIAADYVAAPSTYKVATLAADNKLDPSQIPDTISGGYNFVGVANSAGDLTSTTQGDFYVIQTAFGAYSVGDRAVYDGSAYVRVTDGTVLIEEGGTGAITAATARTNLSVNSIDEDAEATGTKLVGPAMYFNGSSSFMEIAYSSKTSFTDGSSDTPFSFSGWCKKASGDQVYLISKRDDVLREYIFQISATGAIYLELFDSSNNTAYAYTAAGVVEDDKWTHVAATFSANSAASSAADDIVIYKNGVAQSVTAYNAGGYTGMTDNSKPLWVQKAGSSNFGSGEIRNVQIFNRELTATEVAQLAKGNDLGYSDQYAGALGGLGTIDETVGISSWTGTASLTLDNITETANTTVGGRANVLKLEATATTTAATRLYGTGVAEGKRERLSFDYYIPSSNTTIDVIRFRHTSGTQYAVGVVKDAWTRVNFEYENNGSAVFQLELYDATIYNATAGDYVGIDNFSITEIGTLADFRAENYDADLNKLVDISDNAFVGTGTSVSLTGRAYPVYETGTWTPSITFGGGSTGLTVASSEGVYTRVGNIAYISGFLTLSAKGSSTGSAAVTGLPFTSKNTLSSYQSVALSRVLNMAGLASAVDGNINGNATTISLNDTGATGASSLDDTNFTDTTTIRFSATYQIQ